MYPRWWHCYPAATIMSGWSLFSATLPCAVIAYIHLHTRGYMPKYCISTPVAGFGHYTDYQQFDSCCYICIVQHEHGWWEYFTTNDPLKASIQWPRTSTSVNDALSIIGHHLAKGEFHYSLRTRALSFSPLCSNLQYHYPFWPAMLILQTMMWS